MNLPRLLSELAYVTDRRLSVGTSLTGVGDECIAFNDPLPLSGTIGSLPLLDVLLVGLLSLLLNGLVLSCPLTALSEWSLGLAGGVLIGGRRLLSVEGPLECGLWRVGKGVEPLLFNV